MFRRRPFWLSGRTAELDLSSLGVPADATLLLNPDAVGFYRVNYDAAGWRQLRRLLSRRPAASSSPLSGAPRAQLESDLKFLSRLRLMPVAGAGADAG